MDIKHSMGFFDKLKSFGSKIVSGIRKGWTWVKDKVAPVVRKVLPVVSKVAPMFGPKGAVISKVADTADNVMGALGM